MDSKSNFPPGEETPPQPSYRRRESPSARNTVLLVLLAVLLIGGGLALLIYGTTVQYRSSLHAEATFYALATRHTLQTAQAHAQATANFLATAQANIEASATARDNVYATATGAVDDATATANALGDLFTQASSGTPALDDSLSNNTGKGNWDEGLSTDGHTGCTFTDRAYHVKEALLGYFQPCFAQAANFNNLVYSANTTIDQGSQGQAGLLLRVSSDQKSFYFFHIGANGSYAFDRYRSDGPTKTLVQGFNSAINIGLSQSNQLAVLARGNQFYFYVNNQYVDMATDSTLKSGKIGVGVINHNTPVDVEFSSVQVWKA